MIDIGITLKKTGLPVSYKAFLKPIGAPFLTYIGSGQERFEADNKVYHRKNTYQVQLYFKDKDPALEDNLENTLIADEWMIADKSPDTSLDSQDINVIYYEVWRIR